MKTKAHVMPECVGVYTVCVPALAWPSLCLFKGNKCNLRKAVAWNPVRVWRRNDRRGQQDREKARLQKVLCCSNSNQHEKVKIIKYVSALKLSTRVCVIVRELYMC